LIGRTPWLLPIASLLVIAGTWTWTAGMRGAPSRPAERALTTPRARPTGAPDEVTSVRDREGAPAPRSRSSVAERFGVPAASFGPRPSLLQDTALVGDLQVDVAGHFFPSRDALDLFQHFFLASGLEPDEVIRGRIVLEILSRLPPGAAEEAIAALDGWLELTDRLMAAAAAGQLPEDPQARFDAIRALRREVMGTSLADGMFRETELVIQIELDRQAVLRDPRLDAQQRRRRLEELEARLPLPLREARERATAPARIREKVDRMRAMSSPEPEIFALRERAFGREAAERLQALDARRADFDRRYGAYRIERDQLDAAGSPSDPDPDRRLSATRARYFSEDELARVLVFDEEERAAAAP